MKILSTQGWEEYALLDSGNGMRLERYGKFRISRPDPQAIWSKKLVEREWSNIDAYFESDGKKGKWVEKNPVPHRWKIIYKDLAFWARLTPFKHTGVFPEQSLQWDWMQERIRNHESGIMGKLSVLNLFGYTGIASLVCAKAGASVTHVDASKPAVSWARENQELSGLASAPIRFILDDAIKFLQREIKRGVRYDGIIMDPPVYGHGPGGEIWDFNKSFPELMKLCRQVLTEKPVFIVVNAYAISASAIMLENVLSETVDGLSGQIESGELALQEKQGGRLLSTGIFSRWSTA